MSEAPVPVAGSSNDHECSAEETPILSYEELLACLPPTLDQSNHEECLKFCQEPTTTENQIWAIVSLLANYMAEGMKENSKLLRRSAYNVRRIGNMQVNMQLSGNDYPLPIYEDINGKNHPDGIAKKYHHLETFDQICDLPPPILDKWCKFINEELYEIEKDQDHFYRAKSLYASLGGARNASVDAREKTYEMKNTEGRRKRTRKEGSGNGDMTKKKRKTK
ncbi:uncharacterized protein L199_004600 [Kwoniella botswanensis]|uniref:uncharacterized protein n=1 Tax=Kwoniella botswanensis TaxID=1268659 RepID=UPI00315DDA8F